MSLLSGKVLDYYEKWYNANKRHKRKSYMYDTCENAMIIECFDSVGIYIQVGAININGNAVFDYNIQEDNTINGMNGHQFDSRHAATTEAIKQANIIYNNR